VQQTGQQQRFFFKRQGSAKIFQNFNKKRICHIEKLVQEGENLVSRKVKITLKN